MDNLVVPFIYGLIDPLEPKHVRYVGMAGVDPSRPYHHAKNAKDISAKASYLLNWIRTIQVEGREPEVIILEQCSDNISRELLGYVEKCYIKSLREIGHRLTNMTEGGDGFRGSHTEETKKKMSTSRIGMKASEEARQSMRAAQKIIGAARVGTKLSEETKAKMSASAVGMLGQKHSEEAKAKMSAVKLGKKVSQETRIKLSAVSKGLKRSEETKAKMSASQLGRVQSEETKSKIKEARAKQVFSEDAKAKMRESAKASWAKRKAAKLQ